MSGETDLACLLQDISPRLDSTPVVFCTLGKPLSACLDYEPIATMVEKEGLTLVVTKACADKHQLEYSCVMHKITLEVHSSLLAVGLTAAFARALTAENISANVIAGFYHDHIFVPENHAEQALRCLQALSKAQS